MGKIALLDEITINQIAAGEVIEQPASALKELLENSRDAGSSSVTIETQGGGLSLLVVRDDGEGMDEEDLLLAIQRHATSKVRKASDLFHLQTLGFRGEALASIAAISKMTLHSSIGDGGIQLQVVGGKLEERIQKPRQRGTTIEIRDLFYNVPARLAFQKGAAAETAELRRVLTRMALSFPEMGFAWQHEGILQWRLPSHQTLADRILFLLGKEFWTELIEVPGYGFIGSPAAHRPNRQAQYLMINHRFVFSPWISQQVLDSYGTRLPMRRYPTFVLNLNFPPDSIDVNVHPQKKEIRFQHETALLEPLQQAIQRALREAQNKQFGWASTPPSAPMHTFPLESTPLPLLDEFPVRIDRSPPFVAPETPTIAPLALPLSLPIEPVGFYSPYLLLHHQEGIQWIHIPRLLYRIRYEQYRKGNVQQALLFPHRIEVPRSEVDVLIERKEEFEAEGITLRFFGGLTFVVEAIPPWIEAHELQDCIEDLLQHPAQELRKMIARRNRKTAYCLDEALAAWSEFTRQEYPNSSPDGEMISVIMKKERMDGLFR